MKKRYTTDNPTEAQTVRLHFEKRNPIIVL